MKRKTIFISVLVVFIGVLVASLLTAAVSFYILNQTNGTIVVSGEKREYLLHVPTTYDSARPTPLVISMHALALWPAAQMETSHWNTLADELGFIVVYPSGTGVLPKMWRMKPEADLKSGVRFISDLIDRLEATYNIDRTRIYANGYSNGGGMSFVLACTLSNRIAAIGTVAAAQVLPWEWCADSRPVPMIAFHGTADRIVPYQGGPSVFFNIPFPKVPEWAANWARRNRCGGDPQEARITTNVSRVEYANCADDANVVLYTVEGGGHAWPGGKPMPEWMIGPTTRDVDATREMWAFFRQHRLLRN